MNIAIIEDSLPIRREIVRRLRAITGARVAGEASGEDEAVALVAREQPDVVLLDLQLSPGHGMNVLRRLRAAGSTARVLVLTHRPLQAYRLQCEALGVDGFHDKGTDIDVVVARIEDWISQAAAATPAPPTPAPPATAWRPGRDAITALPNRGALLEKLDIVLRMARGAGHAVGVFVVVLEGLDRARRTEGLDGVGQLLAQAAGRLAGAFTDTDVVARVADDGFAVLVTRLDAPSAAPAVAQDIVAAMQAGAAERLPCGVGSAVFPDDGHQPVVLLDLADRRAREAIAGVQGRTLAPVVEEPLLPRLLAAIERGGLSVAYQPQYGLADGRWSGIEALARWNDPHHGTVSPAHFIALAEENGLMDALSARLYDCALADYAAWQRRTREPLPPLALNVSAMQVTPDLVDTLATLLDRHDLAPRNVELEFTETAMLSDDREVDLTLHALREMGFSLALDDFGVGYSSLAMLQRLPISTLKIDRSFVADLQRSPRSHAIVRAIVQLGQGLGLRVIAEGVETREQYALLQRMGCDEVQGYLLGRPMTGEALLKWTARKAPTLVAAA